MASNIAAFTRRIELRAQQLTGEAFRKHHAAVAKRALGEVQREQASRLGAPTPYQRYVDGRAGAAEESVKLYGVIEYTFDLAADVAGWVYEELLRLSPVGPPEGGHYRDDHLIFVDGQQVEDLRNVRAAAEIVFTNTRPYSRKLELGRSFQAPNGIYRVTAASARRRFGNIAEIHFTYRGFISGQVIDPAQAGPTVYAPTRRGARGRFAPGSGAALIGGQHNKRRNRFPVIVIRQRQ